MAVQQPLSTDVVTGKVRLCYVFLSRPKVSKSDDDQEQQKYQVCVLIDKKDSKTLGDIEKAVEAAKQNGLSQWGGKIPANLRLPLRDGDAERQEQEEFQGMYFLNASTIMKPGIVDAQGESLPPDEVYSGCFGRVNINFFPYNRKGNRGIGCGLLNIQKLADGEQLTSRPSAREVFDAAPPQQRQVSRATGQQAQPIKAAQPGQSASRRVAPF
jgi:hypothetical protein